MSSPLETLHKPIVLSKEPDAKYSPSSENTTVHIASECSPRVFMYSTLDNNLIAPSVDPNYFPSPENTTLDT